MRFNKECDVEGQNPDVVSVLYCVLTYSGSEK